MTENSKTEEMKRYLFHEMSEEEYDAVEERYFNDSDYFDELTELENDLVDRYVRSMLAGSDLTRFEQSIDKFSGRHDKIIEARALQSLIAEQKPKVIPGPEISLWDRIAALFNLRAFQLATAAFAFLLICTTGYLSYQVRRIQQELARQQDTHAQEIADRERRISEQIQLKEIEQAKAQTASQKQGEIQTKNDELQTELDALRKQLEEIRNDKNRLPLNKNVPVNNISDSMLTTIFSGITLLPGGGRGKGGGNDGPIPIKSNTRMVNLNIEISPDSTAKTFIVILDDGSTLPSQKRPKTRSGKRFLNVNIPVQTPIKDKYTLTVRGDDGSEETYPYRLVNNPSKK